MDTAKRYHDLVSASRTLNYATRCRIVVDEVTRRYGELVDHTGRSGDAWLWLENELAAAAATPGTMAELLRPASPTERPTAESTSDLRSRAWRRLGSPGAASWGRGPESRSMWSFLMSPAPVDDDERGGSPRATG